MATFAQDETRNLSLVNGQLVLVVDPAAEAAIVLRNKFLFGKGEYFLDIREGVPYFEYVFRKNPDLLLIRRLFRDIIKGTQGISEILSLTTGYDSKTRKGNFSFRARATNGKVVSGGSGQPFIVEQE